MRKKKAILIIMIVLFFLIFLGVVFYFFTRQEEDTGEREMQPEARSKLASEYSEVNEIFAEGMRSHWADGRPDHFGLPYALTNAKGDAGYLMLDLDGDAVDELLVGLMEDGIFMIYGLYSGTADGELNPVWVSPGYMGRVLSKDGRLVSETDYIKYQTFRVPETSGEGEEPTYTGREAEYMNSVAYLYRDGELEGCEMPYPLELMELPEMTLVSATEASTEEPSAEQANE